MTPQLAPDEASTAERKLRARADAFARDAATLREDDLPNDAWHYEAVARELRLAADLIAAEAKRPGV